MRCWGRFRPLGGKVESYFGHNFLCVAANGMIGDKSYFDTYFGKMLEIFQKLNSILWVNSLPFCYVRDENTH